MVGLIISHYPFQGGLGSSVHGRYSRNPLHIQFRNIHSKKGGLLDFTRPRTALDSSNTLGGRSVYREAVMFSKCGNPACHTPFGVSGRIFAADAPEGIDSRFTVLVELTSGMRAVHFYWLCDVCCGLIARTASVFGPDS